MRGLAVFFTCLALAMAWTGCSDAGGPCSLVPAPCELIGLTRCTPDATGILRCEQDADGCLVWVTAMTCPGGSTCQPSGDTVVCAGGCQPSCAGKECGADGCGGTCGTCPAGESCDANGQCQSGCVPDCAGRECGDDGCGWSCGECTVAGEVCVEATGTCTPGTPCCAPGQECGVEPCMGSSCGTCAPGESCDASGQCVASCIPDCQGRECGMDPVCRSLSCGTCPAGTTCDASGQCVSSCTPDCRGRECGMDPVCGTLSCGTCPAGTTCNASGQCVSSCTPDCQGRECGMDPVCGTLSCGTCPSGWTCLASGQCQAPAEDCDDGLDNDGDGAYDCGDSDCVNDPACLDYCPGYTGGSSCCQNSDPCAWAGDGVCDCDGTCAWDTADCNPAEVCNDGLDNDGDGAYDCGDSDCVNDPACLDYCPGYTGGSSCCQNSDPCAWAGDGICDCDGLCAWDSGDCVSCPVIAGIGCGGASASNNGVGPNVFGSYSCVGWSETGPEVAYTFTAPGDTRVTLTLSGMSVDLDLFVLGAACDPAACLAFGDTSAVFDATAGQTYEILVDGYLGAVGDFTLTASCCPVIAGLGCGESAASNNGVGPSLIGSYSCVGWSETGPEVAYTFTAPWDGQVTMTLSGLAADLDIFILDSTCDPTGCLAYGDLAATFTATAGQTYTVLIDGYVGAVSDFTVTATCP